MKCIGHLNKQLKESIEIRNKKEESESSMTVSGYRQFTCLGKELKNMHIFLIKHSILTAGFS
jgi:hypothetical protein